MSILDEINRVKSAGPSTEFNEINDLANHAAVKAINAINLISQYSGIEAAQTIIPVMAAAKIIQAVHCRLEETNPAVSKDLKLITIIKLCNLLGVNLDELTLFWQQIPK